MANKLKVFLQLKADQFVKGIDKAEGKFMRFTNNMKTAWGSVVNLQNAIAGATAVYVTKNLSEAAMQMEALEAKMQAALPIYGASQRELAFVSDEAKRLGLNFRTMASEYATFAASATRSGLSLKETRKIFTDISEAAVSLKMSGPRVSLVFQALTQLSSKGVVSMEELRRQLSDHLPGALQIAARSMNKSNQEFIKMVSSGKILSREFLPKFAEQIRRELGGGFETASQQMQASLNRLKTAWFKLRAGLGFIIQGDLKEGVEGVTTEIDRLNDHMKELEVAFQIIKTPIVIIWNGFQILADSIALNVLAFGALIKNSMVPFIKTGELMVDTVNNMGQAFEALKNRDLEGLKEVAGKQLSDIKIRFVELKDELEKGFEDIKGFWGEFTSASGKNLDDIAMQYVKVGEAYRKMYEEMAAVSTDIIEPGSTGGDVTMDDSKAEKERLKKLNAWRRFKNQIYALEKRWLEGKWRYEEKLAKQILDTEHMLQESRINLMKDGIGKELALLDLKFQKMKEEYKDNAVALNNIDTMYANEKAALTKRMDADQLSRARSQTQMMVDNMGTLTSEWRKGADLYKGIAAAQTFWDTLASAQAAYKAMAGIPVIGPGLGIAAAATATFAGFARVAQIKATEYWSGVKNFRTSGPQMMVVGDNPGGVEEVSVRPVSSPNVSGPSGSPSGGNIIVHVRDYTGGLVETFRGKIRSGEADRLVRDLILRNAEIA